MDRTSVEMDQGEAGMTVRSLIAAGVLTSAEEVLAAFRVLMGAGGGVSGPAETSWRGEPDPSAPG